MTSKRSTLVAQMARWAVGAAVMAFGLGSLGMNCAAKGLALMPGVVNNPANLTLRRAILGFATSTICPEFLQRNLPLQLHDQDPATGRFFPAQCAATELANGNLFLQFSGRGYGWTNVTGRIGFEASASVEYRQDFLLNDGSMYVYFRKKQTQTTSFRALMVERTQAGAKSSGQGITDLLLASVAAASEQIGQRLLQQKLSEGITVIRDSDGVMTFQLGMLEEGERPAVPFAPGSSEWQMLANERTELHSNQRDYVGPFTVQNAEQALYLTAVVEGAPAVDVLVVPKPVADGWIDSYIRQANPTPPPSQPLYDEAIASPLGAPGQPGQPVTPWRRPLRVAPGQQVYLVFDHTAAAGRTNPPAQPLDDRAALVSFAVQLGDAP